MRGKGGLYFQTTQTESIIKNKVLKGRAAATQLNRAFDEVSAWRKNTCEWWEAPIKLYSALFHLTLYRCKMINQYSGHLTKIVVCLDFLLSLFTGNLDNNSPEMLFVIYRVSLLSVVHS